MQAGQETRYGLNLVRLPLLLAMIVSLKKARSLIGEPIVTERTKCPETRLTLHAIRPLYPFLISNPGKAFIVVTKLQDEKTSLENVDEDSAELIYTKLGNRK